MLFKVSFQVHAMNEFQFLKFKVCVGYLNISLLQTSQQFLQGMDATSVDVRDSYKLYKDS